MRNCVTLMVLTTPHLRQQKGYAIDPVGQGILAGWVQENNLFCHGSCLLEPYSEICTLLAF